MAIARWLIGVALAFGLSACNPVDAEQDALCRRAIPALMDATSGIRVLQSIGGGAAAAGDGAANVSIRFWLASDAREHRITCRFAGVGLDGRKRYVEAFALDGERLGEAATFYVVTRWLETPEAVAEQPPPPAGPAIFESVSPSFVYAVQNLLSALPRMGIYALIAAAYALLYGLVGRINLAFGAFAALGGIAATIAIAALAQLSYATVDWGFAAGLVTAVGLAALYGSVAARRVVVPLANATGQQALIASVGLMIALEEFLRLAQGANTIWLPPVLGMPFTVARSAAYDATLSPMAFVVACSAGAACFALLAVLKGTTFGQRWRAVSDDALAAEMFGISQRGVLVQTFAIGCGLAGLAGMLMVIYYGGMGFAGGTMLGLTALVAAILGGIGSVGSAMTGGILLGLIEAIWSAYWPIEHKDAVVFVILIAVLTVRPHGLLGERPANAMRV